MTNTTDLLANYRRELSAVEKPVTGLLYNSESATRLALTDSALFGFGGIL